MDYPETVETLVDENIDGTWTLEIYLDGMGVSEPDFAFYFSTKKDAEEAEKAVMAILNPEESF